MFSRTKPIFTILLSGFLLASCTAAQDQLNFSTPAPAAQDQPAASSPTPADPLPSNTPLLPAFTEQTGLVGMPNPASVYCEKQGGTIEIRTDPDGGQYGVCLFQDGSECDEWAYFRGECAPGQPDAAPSPAANHRYLNEEFGFSFNPPTDWAIEEYPDYVLFSRPGYRVFVGFQSADEEPKPFRTGMPEGEFIDGGQATLLGQAVPKQILVLEGKNKVVAYNGRIKVGGLVMVMYLDAVGAEGSGYRDLDIPQEIISEADQIIASFAFNSGEKPEIEFNP